MNSSLAANPRLEQWLRVETDGRVTVFTGKVEIGQGILSALVQVAAEELELDPAMIDIVSGDTDRCPNEGPTAGSMSIEHGGAALRSACAHAMQLLADQARRTLGCPTPRALGDGRFAASESPNQTIPYAELAGAIDWKQEIPIDVAGKDPRTYRIVGQPFRRADLRATITGAAYIQDIVVPGMLHGRVVRPPSMEAELVSFERERVTSCEGVVSVVRDGSFVGLCAEREEHALAAAETARAAARWNDPDRDPMTASASIADSPSELLRVLREQGSCSRPSSALTTVRAAYSRPFLAHASIGTSCAIATFSDGALTVWTHSQSVFALRRSLAGALQVREESVRVIHVRSAGCYGHNGADDAAFDAVLLARSVPGRPVRVVWSREDELGWSPVGSAMRVEIEASISPEGRVESWTLDVHSGTHVARPGFGNSPNLLAGRHLEQPLPQAEPADGAFELGGGGDRNAVALYDFAQQEVRYHFIPRLPLRTSALRSLGAFSNVFAIESMMDELAEKAGLSPVQFRLSHLTDERAQEVVRRAAGMAGWPDRWEAADADAALGIGFSRYKNKSAYCAVVAEVEAVDEVRIRRVYCAVDAGLAINPDGVRSQLEGGIVQALSWTLKEEVLFKPGRVTSIDWESYPILRFSEVPEIEVAIVDRASEPPLGTGEAAQGPTAAAVANGLSAALRFRVRELPFTRRVIERAMMAGD